MDRLNPEGQRRAEEAASHVLDDESPDAARGVPDGVVPDAVVPDAVIPDDRSERSLYLRHLFVHGLMESLTDESSGAAREARQRRVSGVMNGIGPESPAGRVVRPRAGWRRLLRPVAAAAAVLLIVVGVFAVFSGGGLEARAAVKSALERVDDGFDRMYRGKLTLLFQDEKEPVERAFRSEFHSRGRDRFYGVLELPMGGFGAIPVHFGRVADAVWFDIGMGAQLFEPERMPMMFPAAANPFESVTSLGSLLEMMDRHCTLDWETVEDGALLRIVGKPAPDEEFPMSGLERVVVELDRDGHEVRSIELHGKRPEGESAGMPMMLDVPAGSKLQSVVARLEFVKSYRATDATYWPEELGDLPGSGNTGEQELPEDDG